MSQIRLDENAVAPDTPSAGVSIIYPKSDGLWYSKDDAGVETAFSIGGGTPDPHATSHQNGGSDEVSVAGLSGLLADGQTPLAHKTSHQDGGSDEVSVAGLSGVLADPQPPIIGVGATQAVAGNDARLTDSRTPTAHAASHASGGSDAVKLDNLAAPDDNTDLDASTTLHGLSPKATAPAAGLLSVLAIGNGATVRSDTAIFDTTNPAALGTAAPGTVLVAARRDHVHALPVTRVTGTTSSATPTPDADITDLYSLTALATAPTFGAPTGTPVNGQKLLIRIKDNGTLRALAWNAIYVPGGTALPTTTAASKILTIGFIYNTDNTLNKWQCVGAQQEA